MGTTLLILREKGQAEFIACFDNQSSNLHLQKSIRAPSLLPSLSCLCLSVSLPFCLSPFTSLWANLWTTQLSSDVVCHHLDAELACPQGTQVEPWHQQHAPETRVNKRTSCTSYTYTAPYSIYSMLHSTHYETPSALLYSHFTATFTSVLKSLSTSH